MESEVRSWLKSVLEENIDDFSVRVVKNSGKGDGYIGDIVFVSLTPANSKVRKEYNLVLKCSKRSKKLREKVPVKEVFLNEIYVYDKIFPAFAKFQQEKGIQNVFNSVPSCLGKFTAEDMEVVILENLKKSGYELWNKKKSLTKRHIIMVVEEYAKFHAISVAMQDQQPENFEKLNNGLMDVLRKFLEATGVVQFFVDCIDEISDLLKDHLDENALEIWRSLKAKIPYIMNDMVAEQNGLKVILHGDCWCNNFMFKHHSEDETLPVELSMLDWQVSRFASPILDLSYFLFAGISNDDLGDLVNTLDHYYEHLKLNCETLGTNLESLYPKDNFLEDWKKYCKFGIMMASAVFKLCVTEQDEVVDIVQTAENSEDLETAFIYDVKNKDALRERAKDVVKYVTENRLV